MGGLIKKTARGKLFHAPYTFCEAGKAIIRRQQPF